MHELERRLVSAHDEVERKGSKRRTGRGVGAHARAKRLASSCASVFVFAPAEAAASGCRETLLCLAPPLSSSRASCARRHCALPCHQARPWQRVDPIGPRAGPHWVGRSVLNAGRGGAGHAWICRERASPDAHMRRGRQRGAKAGESGSWCLFPSPLALWLGLQSDLEERGCVRGHPRAGVARSPVRAPPDTRPTTERWGGGGGPTSLCPLLVP